MVDYYIGREWWITIILAELRIHRVVLMSSRSLWINTCRKERWINFNSYYHTMYIVKL